MPAKPISVWEKAAATDRWTEILFRALSARVAKRWRFVSFRGKRGGEWCGIVDVLAIRKDTSRSSHALLKRGDLFDLVLVQMKGGGARMPSAADIRRLRAVGARYGAKAIALFAWKRGNGCRFCVLTRSGEWEESSAAAIFG